MDVVSSTEDAFLLAGSIITAGAVALKPSVTTVALMGLVISMFGKAVPSLALILYRAFHPPANWKRNWIVAVGDTVMVLLALPALYFTLGGPQVFLALLCVGIGFGVKGASGLVGSVRPTGNAIGQKWLKEDSYFLAFSVAALVFLVVLPPAQAPASMLSLVASAAGKTLIPSSPSGASSAPAPATSGSVPVHGTIKFGPTGDDGNVPVSGEVTLGEQA